MISNDPMAQKERKPERLDNALDLLFGSRTRVKILRLFLTHTQKELFVREIVRAVHVQINAVRRELDNLIHIGFLQVREGNKENPKEQRKKFYRLNDQFVLNEPMEELFVKARFLLANRVISALQSMETVIFCAMTGYFLGIEDKTRIDILVVGDVDKEKIKAVIDEFEKEFNAIIRYTVFTEKEYTDRRLVADQFLMSVVESPKKVIVNKLGYEL